MLTASSTGESAEIRCDARQKAPAFAGSGSPLYRRAMLPRECLNKHMFQSLAMPRQIIEAWRARL